MNTECSEQAAPEEAASPVYQAPCAWEAYESDKDGLKVFCDGYLDFLSGCKTERETISWCEAFLKEHGFGSDPAGERWVTTLRGKCLFAFRRGSQPMSAGMRLVAAHADCPRLDFKPHPIVEQVGFCQAKTHYYGGLRKYQWLARPLALHGVICRDDGTVVPVVLGEGEDEPVFTIADLLPHLAQKQVTQTVKDAFEGEKLNVILGSRCTSRDDEGKDVPEPVKLAVLTLLQERFGVREEDFLSAEIEVVPSGRARYVGLDGSLIGAYGQDDRICVYTGLQALVDAAEGDGANLALMLWDKEEIGSDGATGASSRFLEYCVDDVLHAHDSSVSMGRFMCATCALSADVTAGMDPDYQDAHEKHNTAFLGRGTCFEKYTGSGGKYGASEAHAEFFAAVRGVLNRRGIPWQAGELGRVDHGGGGTVALFLAAWGMNVIDCGPALLGMHSPFELSSCADVYASYQTYKAFYEG